MGRLVRGPAEYQEGRRIACLRLHLLHPRHVGDRRLPHTPQKKTTSKSLKESRIVAMSGGAALCSIASVCAPPEFVAMMREFPSKMRSDDDDYFRRFKDALSAFVHEHLAISLPAGFRVVESSRVVPPRPRRQRAYDSGDFHARATQGWFQHVSVGVPLPPEGPARSASPSSCVRVLELTVDPSDASSVEARVVEARISTPTRVLGDGAADAQTAQKPQNVPSPIATDVAPRVP